jgi:hypothetical protein
MTARTELAAACHPEVRRRVFVAFQLVLIAFALVAATPRAHAQKAKDPEIASVRLGFDGVYKLGCWTQLDVTLQGGDDAYTGVVVATTTDADGVPTTVFTPPDHPVGLLPHQTTAARLFIRYGQDGADLRVRFLDNRGKERAKRTFTPGPEPGDDFIPYGLPATTRLIVTFGSERGVGELARSERAGAPDQEQVVHAVRLSTAADLPLEWYGYEGVDALVLGSSEPELYRPLAANPQRVAALRQWVELGGRLVLFCGAAAPELIGAGAPLAGLIPGKFDSIVTLKQSQPLETFAGSNASLSRGGFNLPVPRLAEVRGRILAYDGKSREDLPLVIRARLGLGEVTFVAVDPDAPPIAKWPGRVGLLRHALEWTEDAAGAPENPNTYNPQQGSEDLINTLRAALDQQFVGVKTAPFALVAALVLAYIALIGPGDYFFVKRVLKRMELTWITFPLTVLGVSVAAYWLAWWMKGDQLRVNQVEIVDVDLGSNVARGTVWTHFFSPRVDRYNLSLEPRFGEKPVGEPDRSDPADPSGSPPSDTAASSPQPPASLVAWLGKPGYGLGGMQGQHSQASLFDRGYAYAPRLDALEGMPVQEWSTKTLVARWTADVAPPLDADLRARADDLLAGTIANHSGVKLEDCLLMHAKWAYQLNALADGATATVNDTLVPRPVKATLTGVIAGDETNVRTAEDGSAIFDPASSDVARHAKTMMFYEAIGGAAYARLPNRYQSYVDLSRLLDGDQAILLARAADAAGSQWITADGPLASNQDRRWVYYRFIIPLKKR